MNKQQEAIREMANKKLLNSDQKRMLYRIFEAKINAVLTEMRSSDKVNQEERRIVKKALESSKTLKKIYDSYLAATRQIEKCKKQLEKMNFRIDYDDELDVSSEHKALQAWKAAREVKISKVEALKVKLLSDIYCLPYTADEMTSYINAEVAKINKI